MEIFIYLLIIIGIIIYLLDIIIHLFGSSSSYSKNKKQNNLQDLKPSQSENKSKKESIIKTFVKVDPKEEDSYDNRGNKNKVNSGVKLGQETAVKEYTPEQLNALKRVSKFISDLSGIEELASNVDQKLNENKDYNITPRDKAISEVSTMLNRVNSIITALETPEEKREDFRTNAMLNAELRALLTGHTTSTGKEKQIVNILKSKGITKLYHVTSLKNWKSIQNRGGLYSLYCIKQNNYNVDFMSNSLSHQLDVRKNTQDFIKLSFKKITPMTFGSLKRGKRIILLSIDVKQLLENIDNNTIYFTHMNSTGNDAKIYNITNKEEILNLDFNILTSNRGYKKGTKEHSVSQAEVMVKRHIPIEYITYEKELTESDL